MDQIEVNLWWIWMIIAALFLLGEIFTAGFFLLWFGIGAVAAGLVALFGFGMVWQLIIFIAVSAVLFAVSRKFADRISVEQPPGIGADRFIGKECVVLEIVSNLENTGRVRMGKEEWRAESESGKELPIGARVIVTKISGTQLIVRPVEEGG
jgi:membrane protein implicated in regulation of membrane protease activity